MEPVPPGPSLFSQETVVKSVSNNAMKKVKLGNNFSLNNRGNMFISFNLQFQI